MFRAFVIVSLLDLSGKKIERTLDSKVSRYSLLRDYRKSVIWTLFLQSSSELSSPHFLIEIKIHHILCTYRALSLWRIFIVVSFLILYIMLEVKECMQLLLSSMSGWFICIPLVILFWGLVVSFVEKND